ncbi:hypothetical protein COY51_05955, partial [Candidatus Desantisbacteria bacterium CG_4_10_14_0_8_um_filter_39_17]
MWKIKSRVNSTPLLSCESPHKGDESKKGGRDCSAKRKIEEEMKKKKGLFVSIEGGEGTGKTTQTKLLTKYLAKKGYKVELTQEPGGTRTGKLIRKILL